MFMKPLKIEHREEFVDRGDICPACKARSLFRFKNQGETARMCQNPDCGKTFDRQGQEVELCAAR